jgi:hypothetical protein
MNLSEMTTRTLGTPTRARRSAAAGVLLLGAGACAVTTLADWPLFQTLALLGAIATGAWLVDGSSERFMGPGLAALAVGGGITLYQNGIGEPGVPGEHTIVYPLLGAALLASSFFHPLAARGAGTFLLIVGLIATVDTPWSAGWTLVGVLVSWGVLELIQAGRPSSDPAPGPARSERPAARPEVRTPVGASR